MEAYLCIILLLYGNRDLRKYLSGNQMFEGKLIRLWNLKMVVDLVSSWKNILMITKNAYINEENFQNNINLF